MSGKKAKLLRKEIRQRSERLLPDSKIVMHNFRAFVQRLSLAKRVKLAWKIITKTY